MNRSYSRDRSKSDGPSFSWETVEERDWEGYNHKFVLKQLDDYIDVLNADLRKIKKEAREVLNEIWTERVQLTERVADMEERIIHLAKDKGGLEKKIEVLENDLEVSRKAAAELEKEIRKLNRTVAEARDKHDLLQKRFDEATLALSEERQRLADRITREAHHEVNVLLNRIANSLISDYRSMEKVQSAPITVEVGENLKAQLKTLFVKLGRFGIDFEKEPK